MSSVTVNTEVDVEVDLDEAIPEWLDYLESYRCNAHDMEWLQKIHDRIGNLLQQGTTIAPVPPERYLEGLTFPTVQVNQ